jgi:hypothetical protein
MPYDVARIVASSEPPQADIAMLAPNAISHLASFIVVSSCGVNPACRAARIAVQSHHCPAAEAV